MGKFTPLFLKVNGQKMRKILQIFIIAILAFSCGSNGSLKKSKGELVGVKGNKYFAEKPFGMVLVPGGSFIMGKSDDDMPSIQDAPTKTVTVRSFYMDETEITNAEYRQFVRWVRDSVIRTALAEEFQIDFANGTIKSKEDPGYEYLYLSQKQLLETEGADVKDWNENKNLDDKFELNYFGPTYNNPKSSYSKDSILKNPNPENTISARYAKVIREFLFEEDEIFNDMTF